MTQQESNIVGWLLETARSLKYGQVGVTLTIEAGKIIKFEKIRAETERANDEKRT